MLRIGDAVGVFVCIDDGGVFEALAALMEPPQNTQGGGHPGRSQASLEHRAERAGVGMLGARSPAPPWGAEACSGLFGGLVGGGVGVGAAGGSGAVKRR